MTSEWIPVILSVASMCATVVMGFFYSRMDARYVQISLFQDSQKSIKEDHAQRDSKLSRIENSIGLMGQQIADVRTDVSYLRGLTKGRSENQ